MPELDEGEKQKAEDEQALSASVTYEVIRRQGKKELERPMRALAWSGLAAGLSMGLSLIAEGLLQSRLPVADWRPLIVKLGYPVGFLVVTLGSEQLYTETTLLAVIPPLAERSMRLFRRMLALWVVVFIANVIGTALIAAAMARTSLFEPHVKDTFTAIAREAMAPGALGVGWRGVFAGWLIAVMVWMLPAAESAQVTVIAAITYLIGIAGFSHVIAGSTGALYLVFNGQQSVGAAFGGFIVPALIGNTIGGVALVSALNHAQVMAGEDPG